MFATAQDLELKVTVVTPSSVIDRTAASVLMTARIAS
jgi:hypothetical protein